MIIHHAYSHSCRYDCLTLFWNVGYKALAHLHFFSLLLFLYGSSCLSILHTCFSNHNHQGIPCELKRFLATLSLSLDSFLISGVVGCNVDCSISEHYAKNQKCWLIVLAIDQIFTICLSFFSQLMTNLRSLALFSSRIHNTKTEFPIYLFEVWSWWER